MQHFDSGLRIGGIAGDAEPIRLFFFEFDVDANPFSSEQDVRGTLLFLIATCLSPAITIFFAMDVDFDTDLTAPLKLELDNSESSICDNTNLSRDFTNMCQNDIFLCLERHIRDARARHHFD